MLHCLYSLYHSRSLMESAYTSYVERSNVLSWKAWKVFYRCVKSLLCISTGSKSDRQRFDAFIVFFSALSVYVNVCHCFCLRFLLLPNSYCCAHAIFSFVIILHDDDFYSNNTGILFNRRINCMIWPLRSCFTSALFVRVCRMLKNWFLISVKYWLQVA